MREFIKFVWFMLTTVILIILCYGLYQLLK